MASERFIENNIIRNQSALGLAHAPFIRRCRAGRGYGVVDLLFLPKECPYDVVLVEAKRASSPDAVAKVVGQLLLYRAGLSRFGSEGLQLLRQFAVSKRRASRSLVPKLLKTLSGMSSSEAAWAAMQAGERVQQSRIALWIGLDSLPAPGLTDVVSMLGDDASVRIGIVSVLARNQLEVWSPNNHSASVPAKKSSWRTAKELPAKHGSIVLNRLFAPHEMHRIMAGHIPRDMDQKWFIYWEDNTLYFHRSWTGFCVYVVHFVQEGELFCMCRAEVNRDPEQCKESVFEESAQRIPHLIDLLLLN